MATVTVEHAGLLTMVDVESFCVVGESKIAIGDYLSGRRLAAVVDGGHGMGSAFNLSDGTTRYLGCRIVKLSTSSGCEIDFMGTEAAR